MLIYFGIYPLGDTPSRNLTQVWRIRRVYPLTMTNISIDIIEHDHFKWVFRWKMVDHSIAMLKNQRVIDGLSGLLLLRGTFFQWYSWPIYLWPWCFKQALDHLRSSSLVPWIRPLKDPYGSVVMPKFCCLKNSCWPSSRWEWVPRRLSYICVVIIH